MEVDIKNIILEFVKDLKENVIKPKAMEYGDLSLVEFFFTKMEPHAVASHVVNHVLPYENRIKKKDVSFFLNEKANIFGGLPKERVDYFSNLVTEPETRGGLSDEDKKMMWEYFDILVELAKQYKKNK